MSEEASGWRSMDTARPVKGGGPPCQTGKPCPPRSSSGRNSRRGRHHRSVHRLRRLRGGLPHDVLGYTDTGGVYKPFHLEEELGPEDCGHGQRGCTSCTRACPRSGRGRSRSTPTCSAGPGWPEVEGVTKDMILTRATDAKVAEMGQDGGLVSAILIWALEKGSSTPPSSPTWRATAPPGRQSRRGPDQGGDPGRGGQPVHLLGQHHGLRRGGGGRGREDRAWWA